MYLQDMAERIRACVPSGTSIPDDSDGLFRLYALLALAKGSMVTAEDVHNAWCVWMADRDSTHPALVPFSKLADDVKSEDAPFVTAIHEAITDV